MEKFKIAKVDKPEFVQMCKLYYGDKFVEKQTDMFIPQEILLKEKKIKPITVLINILI